MSKIDDMALFVQIVKTGGLAAAGRKIRLSPASITLRLNALERRYHTRLLNRTTRKISLTDAGSRFFEACLRVVEEVENAEALLRAADENLSGRLRITAPSDFGRQYVAPALSEYVGLYPGVIPQLHLTDNVVDLVEEGYDLAIRYGNLPDSNLVVRHLASNYRVLVASPGYLEKQGRPGHPDDLARHRCLVLERFGEPLQACLRPRDRFWDIPVPKIDSAFDNLLVPQPSWSPSTTQQLRKLVAAPYLAPI